LGIIPALPTGPHKFTAFAAFELSVLEVTEGWGAGGD
jgi:hypothetical protein